MKLASLIVAFALVILVGFAEAHKKFQNEASYDSNTQESAKKHLQAQSAQQNEPCHCNCAESQTKVHQAPGYIGTTNGDANADETQGQPIVIPVEIVEEQDVDLDGQQGQDMMIAARPSMHNRLTAGGYDNVGRDLIIPKSNSLSSGSSRALVSMADYNSMRLGDGRGRKGRELAAKKYCGKELIEMLEYVCNNRFYDGEQEPQTIEPTVKSRRSLRMMMPPISSYEQALLGASSEVIKRKSIQTQLQNDDDEHSGTSVVDVTSVQAQQQHEMNLDGGLDYDKSEPAAASSKHQQQRYNNNINRPTNYNNIIPNPNNDPFINGNLYHGRPLLRRIRGATEDCCRRSCHADELKLYCQL